MREFHLEDIDRIPDGLLSDKEELSGDRGIIAGVVGVRNTLKLGQVLQGSTVYFRNFAGVLRKLRDKKIRTAYDQGKSAAVLAREFHLTQRRIWSILSETDD